MDGALEGVSVLVVDDDAAMRTLVCRMLKRMNIGHILEADGGEQALDRLATAGGKIDLVICDWNMPGMSGVDLFRQVHPSRPQLPFLMLTGRADLDSVVAAKKAGVHGYIVKPISPQELKTKITFLLSHAPAPTARSTGSAAASGSTA
ncbi:MAG TPA: response regulator [Stellaceae bacterium]|jgi:two-component system chemotaxis response regulator CheY|nr:response regulator [Stellaceae bacterium]